MKGLIVDLFAGGGGASTGLAWALGRDPDIARVLPLEATGGLPVAILHASPDCSRTLKQWR